MKTNIVVLTSFLIAMPMGALAQQEPEYVNQFFYLDSSSAKLMPLERANAVMKSKVKALGYAGGETYYQVKGKKSNVRFKSGQKMAFVVRGYAPGIDPMTMYKLAKLQVKKKGRRLLISKGGGLTAAFTEQTLAGSGEGLVPFNAARYGKQSLKIAPAQPLGPGEYCLSAASAVQFYCFGID